MMQKHRGPAQLTKIDGELKAVANVIEVKQSADLIELFVYDEIKSDGVDWWTGEKVESETSVNFVRQVLDESPKASQINMYVNSRGGSVLEAMGIRAVLARHPAHKTAYVDGWAASAASFILTACEEVVMLVGAMQMLHDMWTIAIGNASELRKVADDMDRMMVGNRQIYLERAGDKLTDDRLQEIMAAETWLTADECIEYGLADRVIRPAEYSAVRPSQEKQECQDGVCKFEPPEKPQSEPEPPDDNTEARPEEPAPETTPKQSGWSFFMAAMIDAAERKENEKR